jgi:hypothetical protein
MPLRCWGSAVLIAVPFAEPAEAAEAANAWSEPTQAEPTVYRPAAITS